MPGNKRKISFDSTTVPTPNEYFTWWVSNNLPPEIQKDGWRTKLDSKAKLGKGKKHITASYQHIYSYNLSLFDLPRDFFQNYVKEATETSKGENQRDTVLSQDVNGHKITEEEENECSLETLSSVISSSSFSLHEEDLNSDFIERTDSSAYSFERSDDDDDDDVEEEEEEGTEANGREKDGKNNSVSSKNLPLNLSSLSETTAKPSISTTLLSNALFECRKCNNLKFLSKLERDKHYKSEWHVYNIKRQLYRQPAVTEEEYLRLHREDNEEDEDGNSVIEGRKILSRPDSEDHGADDVDAIDNGSDEENDLVSEIMQNESAQLNFAYINHAKILKEDPEKHKIKEKEDDTQVSPYNFGEQRGYRFSLWSALLSTDARRESNRGLLQLLSSFQCSPYQNNIWAIFMIRSGQFAAAIFDGKSQVLVHKTFKRYTTRRKAGGSQSAHDSKGKSAKSIGAQLRRYNELRFREDIRKVLTEWFPTLKRAHYIFYSIPKTLRTLLLASSEENSNYTSTDLSSQGLLFRNDPRIRSIPFMVDAPSFASVQTVHAKLSTIKFLELETKNIEGSLLEERKNQNNEKTSSFKKELYENKESSENVEEEDIVVKNTPLFEMCKVQDLEGIKKKLRLLQSKSLLGMNIPELREDSESLNDNEMIGNGETISETLEGGLLQEFLDDYDVNNYITNEQQLSCLHMASSYGNKELMRLLLVCGANPCLKDARGRVPYFLCPDRMSRDVFRVYRGENPEPEAYDWDNSNVPEPLTDAKKQKQKEKQKAKKQKAKQRKKEEKEALNSQTVSSTNEDNSGSSDEDIMSNPHSGSKFAKQNGYKGCWQCGVFKKKLPFKEMNFEFCSESCIKTYKREQMANAAQKRIAFLQKQKQNQGA